jgi:hypothetical protein
LALSLTVDGFAVLDWRKFTKPADLLGVLVLLAAGAGSV